MILIQEKDGVQLLDYANIHFVETFHPYCGFLNNGMLDDEPPSPGCCSFLWGESRETLSDEIRSIRWSRFREQPIFLEVVSK